MSADKHKGLATRAAYLRAAAGESGLGLNVKWAARLTPFLMRMIDDGEIRLQRVGSDGRGGKAITTAFATPAGVARLKTIETRFGAGFGTGADISRVEPSREDRTHRRKRKEDPEIMRAKANKRRAIIAARMSAWREQCAAGRAAERAQA